MEPKNTAGNALVEAMEPFTHAIARACLDAGLRGFGARSDLKAADYTGPRTRLPGAEAAWSG